MQSRGGARQRELQVHRPRGWVRVQFLVQEEAGVRGREKRGGQQVGRVEQDSPHQRQPGGLAEPG